MVSAVSRSCNTASFLRHSTRLLQSLDVQSDGLLAPLNGLSQDPLRQLGSLNECLHHPELQLLTFQRYMGLMTYK